MWLDSVDCQLKTTTHTRELVKIAIINSASNPKKNCFHPNRWKLPNQGQEIAICSQELQLLVWTKPKCKNVTFQLPFLKDLASFFWLTRELQLMKPLWCQPSSWRMDHFQLLLMLIWFKITTLEVIASLFFNFFFAFLSSNPHFFFSLWNNSHWSLLPQWRMRPSNLFVLLNVEVF